MANERVSQTDAQANPYLAKASEFKSAGDSEQEEAGGKNELFRQSEYQAGPRCLEGEMDGPSVWGKGGKAFPIGRAVLEGTAVGSRGCSVDFATGEVEVVGYRETPADEVDDPGVSIG